MRSALAVLALGVAAPLAAEVPATGVIPTVANTTAIDPADSSIEQQASGQADGSTGTTSPSSPAVTTFDPASGS